ncbi:MAG: alpha/beta hydrolase [Idiomarina sp.]|nr:alpha/beta hydrolase [Idiomarina sp.]
MHQKLKRTHRFGLVTRVFWLSVIVTGLVLSGLWLRWYAPDIPVAELKAAYAPMPSQFMAIEGMQVHIRDQGDRDDPEPILLLHGTSASLHTWEGWMPYLTPQRRVIRVDMPGFGLTGPEPFGDYHVERYVDFVMAVANALELEHFILGGNSFGGRIAWTTALNYPDRVTRLILLNASGGFPIEAEHVPLGFRLAQMPLIRHVTRSLLPRHVVRASLENVYANPTDATDELIDLYEAMTRREGNRTALLQRFAQASVSDESDRLATLTQPTLILWGAHDRLIPVANAHRYAEAINHSQLVIFDTLGHVPHEENPELSIQPVLEFLR